MKFAQVTIALVALVGYAIAAGYGSGSGSGGYGGGAGGSSYGGGAGAGSFGGGAGGSRGFGSGGGGGFGGGSSGAPEPYQFDYNAVDEQGNTHYRKEQGDANGAVKGTYGYTDTQGLYRVVEYVADENGYRANIRTNEPGTDGKESPADVVMTVEDPPAGLQDRFTSAGGRSGGAGGFSGGSRGFSGGAGGGAGAGGANRGFSSGGAGRGGAGVRSGKSGY